MERTAHRFLLAFRKLAGKPVALALATALFLVSGAAHADFPRPWQMDLQTPVTPVAVGLVGFWHELLWIITAIMIFVLVLMGYIIVRFRAGANPTPSTTTHNTKLEVIWTLVPILVLVFIAVPSFQTLYFQEIVPPSPITLKVTANQWYWHYAYPDNGNFGFDSNIVDASAVKPGQEHLLEVDNEVVLPVNTNVRIIIAGNDVLHSFFVPSLGIQKYAVPGHLNEVWVNITQPGTYYGECNQICGANHAFMPIKVHAVSMAEFNSWLVGAQKQFALEDNAPPTHAVADAAPAASAVRQIARADTAKP
jgi:cytochrome c oxidase subunit 2